MSFLKKYLFSLIIGIFSLIYITPVFAEFIQPDCSWIQDGVVTCTIENNTLYTECYKGQPLQMIGASEVWQKADTKQITSWKNAKKDTIKELRNMGECSKSLSFEIQSYEKESRIPMLRELPVEFLRIAVWLLILLIILMWVRHHKQCKEKKTGE